MALKHGEYKVPGGKLVVADLELSGDVFRNVQLSGDFFLEPDSLLELMCAALEGQSALSSEAELAATVQSALPVGAALIGLTPEGVARALKRALSSGEHP